jgi:hypothetical protein
MISRSMHGTNQRRFVEKERGFQLTMADASSRAAVAGVGGLSRWLPARAPVGA